NSFTIINRFYQTTDEIHSYTLFRDNLLKTAMYSKKMHLSSIIPNNTYIKNFIENRQLLNQTCVSLNKYFNHIYERSKSLQNELDIWHNSKVLLTIFYENDKQSNLNI